MVRGGMTGAGAEWSGKWAMLRLRAQVLPGVEQVGGAEVDLKVLRGMGKNETGHLSFGT